MGRNLPLEEVCNRVPFPNMHITTLRSHGVTRLAGLQFWVASWPAVHIVFCYVVSAVPTELMKVWSWSKYSVQRVLGSSCMVSGYSLPRLTGPSSCNFQLHCLLAYTRPHSLRCHSLVISGVVVLKLKHASDGTISWNPTVLDSPPRFLIQ